METSAHLRQRWERLYTQLRQEGLGATIVCGSSAAGSFGPLAYLTGFIPVTRHAYALLQPGRTPKLFIPSDADLHAAQPFSQLGDVVVTGEADASSNGSSVSRLIATLRGESLDAVGVIGLSAIVPAGHYRALADGLPRTRIVDASELLAELKAKKEPYEIDKIRDAVALVEGALEKAASLIAEGMLARELAASLDAELRRRGAFRSLVFADHGSQYARLSTNTILQRERLITILVEAASPEGYWAEVGGGFSIGLPTPHEQAIADACREALQRLRHELKPGVPVATAHRIYRQVGEEAGLRLGRGLGHGVGVDHDAPSLTHDSSEVFQVGNVLSVHPHYRSSSTDAGCSFVDMLLIEPGGATSLLRNPPALTVLASVTA